MTRINVCHVNLARGFGGGERQTFNVIKALKAKEIEQVIVLLKGSPLRPMIEELGIPVHEVAHHFLGHIKLAGLKPDIFHAHDGKAVYWCALQGRLKNVPYIVTRRVDNRLKQKMTTRAAYTGAARVACLSRAIEKQVHKLEPQIITTIVPSTYSSFQFAPEAVAKIRQQFANQVLVAQVGNLLHHKGFHITVEVARLVAAAHPEIHFLILGSGEMEAALKAQAAGLKNVTFFGHQNNIGDYLAAVDILLFPSLSEGFGSSILEAWQHNAVVIGTNAGGIPDIIDDNETGLLVQPGDVKGLREALLKLTSNVEARLRLSKNAKEKLAYFSPEALGNRYFALYQEILLEKAQ